MPLYHCCITQNNKDQEWQVGEAYLMVCLSMCVHAPRVRL